MPRILQTMVPTLFPRSGAVDLLLMGEAPGPRGADQSGIPFWGDRAGLPVYRALAAAGRAQVPEGAFAQWDGALLRDAGLAPRLRATALGNAHPSCPTRDGQTFRAPTDAELRTPANLARLAEDLDLALSRCQGRLRVITLGRRAAFILELVGRGRPLDVFALPHPSSQGLLQAAPGRGKGLRLADLRAQWERQLAHLLGQ
jgi:uracil-DNA glycosylase